MDEKEFLCAVTTLWKEFHDNDRDAFQNLHHNFPIITKSFYRIKNMSNNIEKLLQALKLFDSATLEDKLLFLGKVEGCGRCDELYSIAELVIKEFGKDK